MAKGEAHSWGFKPRFRRRAFGWRSRPAIERIQQALREIRKIRRTDPVLAAEGAVTLLERLPPALEQVDSSSGAIGTAVDRAIAELAPVIAEARVDPARREKWLERLYEALAADEMPYIELLAERWGEVCGSTEIASAWADRLLGITRMALSQDKRLRGHFHGTPACLSALHRAGRYQEIVDLLHAERFWHYKRWQVKALAAMGEKAEAIRLAESCRGPWTSERDVDALCEEILLSSGLRDEAYARYGLCANREGTYLATFRAVAKKYPHKHAAEILADLAATTPGQEGKWFAAAKEAGLYDEALALARRTPCDPKTLTRAARDFAVELPAFAVDAGLLALHWLAQGHGYEIAAADVWAAYSFTMKAAERNSNASEIRERIREIVERETAGERFVTKILGRELGLG